MNKAQRTKVGVMNKKSSKNNRRTLDRAAKRGEYGQGAVTRGTRAATTRNDE